MRARSISGNRRMRMRRVRGIIGTHVARGQELALTAS
jgi:hypothetical protein